MRFSDAIEQYIRDQRAYGRMNSDATEVSYRSRLGAHCDDVANRDPRKTGRDDVKKTLRRWTHPNTQRQAHAVLTSFYKWCQEEGLRDTNPADLVRRAKPKKPRVYRLTRGEVLDVMDACHDARERWAVHIMLLTGARSAEIRALTAGNFARPGWVRIHGKGDKERWVPVLEELEPIVEEIQATRRGGEHLFCGRYPADPPRNTRWTEHRDRAGSAKALWEMVVEIGKRAEISAHIHPHLLRHAYGDHVAKYAGLRAAQALLGHEDVSTTQGTYVGEVGLDELAASIKGFTYRRLSPDTDPETPHEATTGIEPVIPGLRPTTPENGTGGPR